MVGEDAPEDRVRDCRRAYIVRRRVRVRQAGEGGCGHGKSLLPEGESCAPLAKAGRPAQRSSLWTRKIFFHNCPQLLPFSCARPRCAGASMFCFSAPPPCDGLSTPALPNKSLAAPIT